MKPETVFKKGFRAKIEEIPYSWWVKVSLPSILGIPDILGCIHGKFIAIELKKSAKDKADPMQKYHLDIIASCKGRSYLACPENAEEILKELWLISG